MVLDSYLYRVDSYKIKIKQIEGPLDLFLFIIERDELDIYDIPKAQITTLFNQKILCLILASYIYTYYAWTSRSQHRAKIL